MAVLDRPGRHLHGRDRGRSGGPRGARTSCSPRTTRPRWRRRRCCARRARGSRARRSRRAASARHHGRDQRAARAARRAHAARHLERARRPARDRHAGAAGPVRARDREAAAAAGARARAAGPQRRGRQRCSSPSTRRRRAGALAAARARRASRRSRSLGIHAYRDPALGGARGGARARGRLRVRGGSRREVAREQGMLARGETTAADAYLTPLLRRHVDRLAAELPGARLRFMQSSGGLTEARALPRAGRAALRARRAAWWARRAWRRRPAVARAIGFDMGGTSTDVSLVVDGESDRAFETVVAGVRVRAPMLRIHTVAAGGGSLCRFDGFRLTVGPESAGADPGPLCYGRRGRALARAHGREPVPRPRARRALSVPARARARGAGARGARRASSRRPATRAALDEVAAGFVEVANARMAQAIQEVSVRRGVDPRDFALVGFGGAAGQHVCARRAPARHAQRAAASARGPALRVRHRPRRAQLGRPARRRARALAAGSAARARAVRRAARRARAGRRGDARARRASPAPTCERSLDLRYVGSETALGVPEPERRRLGGGLRRPARARASATRARAARPRGGDGARARERACAAEARPSAAAEEPAPRRAARVGEDSIWFPGVGRVRAKLIDRDALAPGDAVEGPAVVLEARGTLVLDPGLPRRR